MKKLSMDKLISTVQARREALGLTKKDLAEKCGMNRTMISHMENHNYVPSIKQLQDLAEALEFDPTDVFAEEHAAHVKADRKYKIAVAGTGYVGLSVATLLAQHNQVTCVDILEERVDKSTAGSPPFRTITSRITWPTKIWISPPPWTERRRTETRNTSSSPHRPTTTARRISSTAPPWKRSSSWF